MQTIQISVIISTYNSFEWLTKVLWGYNEQTFKNFEVVIADDGSKEETINGIKEIKKSLDFPVQHIWHEDKGFQKSQILNKAILATKGDYIIMSDGDCIPREDFVAVHNKFKNIGCFLSGGYFMLPMQTSKAISTEDIKSGNCFTIKWLKENGLKKSSKNKKLTSNGFKSILLNFITPTKATWNGHNASGWKKDIVAVNGFDERMQYGGQDRELGERLKNYGIKSKQIRYNAIVIHLDHKRGYANEESWKINNSIRKTTRKTKKTYTKYGIKKG